MNKGASLRLIAHNILYDIKKMNINMDISFLKNVKLSFSSRDLAFINNVCLNTMRYSLHTQKIIQCYVKKKPRIHEEILLSSAITQIVFLDFKPYAVIDSTVEISKKIKLYHGFINSCLRKISSDKNKLINTKINISDLPHWFKQQTKNLTFKEREEFLKNYYKEPNLHIVFKNQKYLSSFSEKIYPTSNNSGFLIDRKKIENISSFKDGYWWIQDYSSSFALNNVDEKIIDKSCFDMCSAPGGKSFQLLAKNKKVTLNDKSSKRLEILRKNMKRLKFKNNIINFDYNKLNARNKYDFIVIDAPCSSIGTIRKNPEIFFKKKGPNFTNLFELQQNMLNKAATILNDNGVILYMVCSFIKNETVDQINEFLNKNKNFVKYKFSLNNIKSNSHEINNLVKNDYMLTLPSMINGFTIDGYFAIYLKKIVK